MQEMYSGEILERIKYISNICRQQALLFGFTEIHFNNACMNSLCEAMTKITHNEAQKYFCLGPNYSQYTFNSLILNREDNFADIECMLLASSILDSLHIKYQLHYDYAGCSECQAIYQDKIINFLEKVDFKGESSKNNVSKNSFFENDLSKSNLSTLSYSELLKQAIEVDPAILASFNLCPRCLKEKQSVFNGINLYLPGITQHSHLISDNTKLIYEFRNKNKVLISGGHLENNIPKFLINMPIIGFTLNIKEVLSNAKLSDTLDLDVIILIEKLEYRTKAFDLVNMLRSNGFKSDIIMQEKIPRLMHTRKYLLDQSARIVILFEAKQVKRDMLILKDLNSGTTNVVSTNSIIPTLKGILNREF